MGERGWGGEGGAVQKFAGGCKIFWTATAHAHKKKEKGEIEKKLTYMRQITYVKHNYIYCVSSTIEDTLSPFINCDA